MSFCYISANAQVAGDTIVVQSYDYSHNNYGSGTKDTIVNFPNDPNLTFEKIIMKYNMRCKGGGTGNGVPPNGTSGCGEWDYSCNTYIVDSTKTDSTKATHPSHIIPGFSGSTYDYTANPTYTYYQYTQQNVVNTSTITETVSTIGTGGSLVSTLPFNAANRTSKSQYLWEASELTAAGVVAGDITSIRLNVTNLGSGQADYLRIRMKSSNKDSLTQSDPDLTGFTEVYFLNTTLTAGINEFNFYNNFNWNGTDNILVEFSFTNDTIGMVSMVAAAPTTKPMSLFSSIEDYALEFNGGSIVNLANNSFSNFSDEITVAFWSNGNPDVLPKNTSIIHAANAQNQRELNVHHPWSNSRIYWDCGNSGSYDRIDKAATATEIAGEWNHYAFTKNTTTGIMNIYLNGTLWHTGTGKTIPFQLTDFVIGASNTMTNPYFGKIDDFKLWNKELDAADVALEVYSFSNNNANLMTMHDFNEGVGTSLTDYSTTAANSTINGQPNWYFIRGKDIFKQFVVENTRPITSFVQGTYTQTITPVIVTDSVENYKNTVYGYAVSGNAIVPVDTNYYYPAGYSYVYDGDNNMLLDSVLNTTQGTVNITTLNYFQTSPARFQIMSFVTPYGNGLNLGPDGKTWTFDVTDFAPILKGSKKMSMDAGGQWQEDMDIKFLFIVGTPPRDVLDINNIWRVESTNNANIINDDKYEPRSVPMKANATSFKIRSAITGHGQEGEFIPRMHNLAVGSTTPQFNWNVWKECAENPVYPQGGTWIYDRAGWCPGMATDVEESDITQYVTPGQSTTIDYNMVAATGTSRYWVSHQLVEYGSANFALDAAIVDIKNPTNKVEYARTNPFCDDPLVVIRNTGSTPLTSLKIEYWVNNNTTKSVYNWTGNLAFLEEVEVELPSAGDIYNSVNTATDNYFHVEVSEPNGGTDENIHNNKMLTDFDITGVVPAGLIVWVRTNNVGSQTSYRIMDSYNNTILSRSGLADATSYLDTLTLPIGCYTFEINDAGENGLSFFASPNDGTGFARFRRTTGGTIMNFQPNFGKSLIYNFTVDYALSNVLYEQEKEVLLFPNPAHDAFTLEGENIEQSEIVIYNSIGQALKLPQTTSTNSIRFNSSSLATGIYQIVIFDKEGQKQTKRLLVE